ncbi:MAG: hypothetical protein ABJA84_00115 [Polaromonas sp.]
MATSTKAAKSAPAKSAFPGRGGARIGAGRKKLGTEKPPVVADFDEAKARKETALADMHELLFKIKSQEYISRAAVSEASATLLAGLAQGMRSLPDNLERKFNLAPEIAVEIERVIDACLADVASGMEQLTQEGEEA